MFSFIKKLFSMDKETAREAGIQIEQAPYKVEVPQEVVAQPVVAVETPEPVPAPKVKDKVTAKKPAAMTIKSKAKTKAAIKKAPPAKKATGAKRGPKPKA